MDLKRFLVSLVGTLLELGVAILTVVIFKSILLAKSSLLRNAEGKLKGLTAKAKERAEASGFYQRREMGRSQRKAERQRKAVEGYAQAITYEGPSKWRQARAARLRQRAGGWNPEARQRAFVSGLGQIEKLESQETKDAEFVLKARGVQGPGNWAIIAQGGTVNGVVGKGNEALQRAAIRNILKAQDGGALDTLVQSSSPDLDRKMLVQEMQDHYQDTKAAGAHFVQMTSIPDTGFSANEVRNMAVQGLSGLAAVKLAAQDGPSAKRAVEGFALADPSTLDERRKMWDTLKQIYSDPQALGLVKKSARDEFDKMFQVVPGPPGTPPIELQPRP